MLVPYIIINHKAHKLAVPYNHIPLMYNPTIIVARGRFDLITFREKHVITIKNCILYLCNAYLVFMQYIRCICMVCTLVLYDTRHYCIKDSLHCQISNQSPIPLLQRIKVTYIDVGYKCDVNTVT